MTYGGCRGGIFRSRPNRFIARVEIDGAEELCHVKNTGRCRELLVPGARVFAAPARGTGRKTRFDLVTVEKGGRLVNIDSQAPNRIFAEWARENIPGITLMKPECTFGNSRFDFYIEAAGARMFAEVKGVTLEKDGVLLFPDAPTERGVKHLRELARCAAQGYAACAAFVIQMKGARYLAPNTRTHPAFAQAMREAQEAGVRLTAFDCRVTPDSVTFGDPVPIRLAP